MPTRTIPKVSLDGARVLIVEDEAMVSLMLEDMLLDLGCVVVGPAARIAGALELVGREAIDAAVLDVNVAGEKVFPVADALAKRGVPFVFATGYGEAGVPDPHRNRPILQKPFRQQDLIGLLSAGLSQASAERRTGG